MKKKQYNIKVRTISNQHDPRNVSILPVDVLTDEGDTEPLIFKPGVAKTAWVNVTRVPREVVSDSERYKVYLDFGEHYEIEFPDLIVLDTLTMDLTITGDIRDLLEDQCSIENILRDLFEKHGKITMVINPDGTNEEPSVNITMDAPFLPEGTLVYEDYDLPEGLSEMFEMAELVI